MLGEIIRANVVCKNMIPNVSDDLAKALNLKPHQRSIGLITGSIDDVTFIALDEATKAADVEVVYGECLFSAFVGIFTSFAGEALGILAGENPAEVQSGLDACADYIENGAFFVNANDKGESIYLSHCISSTGSYLSETCEIPAGMPIAYCIAPPIEAIYGIDAALKAADVKICKTFLPPTATSNFSGALMTGSQSACKAACDAFAQAVQYIANNPIVG
ncbi:ethanolamine utilization microcompartment protein EutL [Acetobacterium bakii]|uniref:Ethanolamine utilization protein EutL n=1 Tax=Acetobacterium bakii TaxID=52689 RepID=A0A0L6U3Y1_9FIRM|nr:ethanolamine utilization microcompartment protein EutL [Acetobacterium bakii]KNZ42490.1 ethanolamine utilization protein EutL [Acetobacterium bakii]